MNEFFSEEIPFKKKLDKLIGSTIVDMDKCSYENFDDSIDYLDEFKLKNDRDEKSFFQYSYGSLLIIFNNSQFSFSSAEDLNSIIVCCEKDFNNNYKENYILEDEEVLVKTSVSNINNKDFLEVLGVNIVNINILTNSNLNSKQACLPSETGLEFNFENGRKLILSHNLTENSFVFSVLTEKDLTSSNVIKRSLDKTR